MKIKGGFIRVNISYLYKNVGKKKKMMSDEIKIRTKWNMYLKDKSFSVLVKRSIVKFIKTLFPHDYVYSLTTPYFNDHISCEVMWVLPLVAMANQLILFNKIIVNE